MQGGDAVHRPHQDHVDDPTGPRGAHADERAGAKSAAHDDDPDGVRMAPAGQEAGEDITADVIGAHPVSRARRGEDGGEVHRVGVYRPDQRPDDNRACEHGEKREGQEDGDGPDNRQAGSLLGTSPETRRFRPAGSKWVAEPTAPRHL